LIASAAGFSFLDFLTHSLPIVLVAWLVALAILRYLFRHELAAMPDNSTAIYKIDTSEVLTDRVTARRVLIVLCVALVAFFFQGALGISPAFIALLAAAAALMWVRPDPSKVLKQVEWSVLLFFAALFVMVGGLEATGALESLVSVLNNFGHLTPVLFGVILIWIVAGISAVVDNVPVTIALIPIIQGLGASGMNIGPLYWALVFGAGFGGNGTIIGSTANIVVANLSEHTRTPITSKIWNKRGLPIMLATCMVASVLYILAYTLYIR
jgi:Na+/H+ antiporter NhaD/arsenite permease-like protein